MKQSESIYDFGRRRMKNSRKQSSKPQSHNTTSDSLILFSDLHGTLEGLFQPLFRSGLLKYSRDGSYIKWKRGANSRVMILGDLTNRVALDGRTGGHGELKNEELLILVYISYLNDTHPSLSDPIQYVLGNHDYENLIGFRSKCSEKCRSYMRKLYNSKTIVDFPLPGSPDEYDPRTLFFTLCNNLEDSEKSRVCRDIVENKKYPPYPLFFRDFLKVRVCIYSIEYNILSMHGGMHPRLLKGRSELKEWCHSMNMQAQDCIVKKKWCPDIVSITNNTEMAGSVRCLDMKDTRVAIGHMKPRNNKAVICDKLFRLDFGNNARSQCKNDSVPCTIAPVYVKLKKDQTFAFVSEPIGRSTGVCKHGKYKYVCKHCNKSGRVWSKRDYL